jgi:hypothetical protein
MVTDSLGCAFSTQNFEITSPDSLMLGFDTSNEIEMQSDGWAVVFVTGGTSPYTYQWDTVASSSTAFAANLAAGTYTVTVTDDEGCTTIDSVLVDRTTSVISTNANGIRIYPNPAREYVIVEGGPYDAALYLYSAEGRLQHVYVRQIQPDLMILSVQGLPPGIYVLRVNGDVWKIVVQH